MTLLGHITPEVINIFLSEAADLLGQWDEACFGLENGNDPREALLWISRTIQSLRRASRGIGLEEFSQTLNSADEYVRMVLRASAQPGSEVVSTLMMTHSVLGRWVVGLRTDPHYQEDLSELNDSIRQQKSSVHQILEEEKRISEAKSLSTEDEVDDGESQPKKALNRMSELKNELENNDWSVFDEGEKRIDRLLALVARISTQQWMLEHKLKSSESLPELRRLVSFNANLVADLREQSVGLRHAEMGGMLEKLGHFAIESAQTKGCAVQFDYDGHSTPIDKKLLAMLWEPLSRIVRWMIEYSFETPEDRVRSGKLPMGVLRVTASSNGSTYKVILEDDGRGQGDGDSTPYGQSIRSFVDTARGLLRELSASLNIHSVVGKSTRFEIAGPVSPWLIETTFVSCSDAGYAVPQHQIEEVIEPGTFSTHILRGDKQLIEFNGRLYPFVTLTELLEKAPAVRRRVQASVAIEKGHALLVRYGRDSIAIGVDAVVGHSKVVVTPLQPHLSEIRGLAGTLVSGTGEPVLLVDLHEITESFVGNRREREVA